jgi:hypothetical protein
VLNTQLKVLHLQQQQQAQQQHRSLCRQVLQSKLVPDYMPASPMHLQHQQLDTSFSHAVA